MTKYTYKKFLIGVIASERNNFSWHFIDSLLRLKAHMGSSAIVTCVHSGTIPDGRNAILDIARDNGCDYALMVDSDMTFPADGIDKLLSSMTLFDAKIACGLYFGTYPPFQSKPMAYSEVDGRQTALDEWKGTMPIHSCGMGFTLIDKDLFDIKFEFRPLKGEDHLFCEEARKRGCKIILEPSVKCGHLRLIPLDEDSVKKLYP